MSDAKPYVPVPVEAARDVAHGFEKNIVVIVSWDREHNRLHTTTYGVGAGDKVGAAKLGEILTKAAGIDLTQKVNFEDFRERTQADWAVERERLKARVRELEDAGRKVYADLIARLEAAPGNAVPVFRGLAELHDALNRE